MLRRHASVAVHQLLQTRSRVGPERTRAPFVALPMETDGGARLELEMPHAEVRGLLDARPRVVQEEEQRAIALRRPGAGWQAREERGHVAAVQIGGLRRWHAFDGNADHLLRRRQALRHPIAEIRKERPQHRQPMVSRAHVVVSVRFERPQEGQDSVGGQGAQGQRDHRPADILSDEAQEEPHPVAVAPDGRWAQPLGHRQVINEERMDDLSECERGHGRPSVNNGRASSSNRPLAAASRSAVMVR